MPLGDQTVDLVVTSPPYANAIDYMRAHKFSLVWLGRSTRRLSHLRSRYIGAERVAAGDCPPLPEGPERVIAALGELDGVRSRVLRRYFTEMARATSEMFRVLRSDAAAVIVVGTSTMRGLDVQTHTCLAEIAASAGFDVVGIGRRTLDRNRRMLPVSRIRRTDSTIERRMHEEHVIGLWKN
jgi:DNA modification methylase